MVRKVLYPAVFVFVALMATSAIGQWQMFAIDTATVATWGIDGRVYMPNGLDLVPTGALVQFIVDTEGDGIDDPLAYFGGDLAAITAWVNAGADPSVFSDDQLWTAANWDGQTAMSAPGVVEVFPQNPYVINNGDTGAQMAWRAWNLSAVEMETFCTRPDEELWYTTGRELGTYAGSADEGWWVGAPSGALPENWTFSGTIGYEVFTYLSTQDPTYRDQNRLDVHLATCPPIPEPGTMLLIGSSVLLLLIRRKK